MLWLICMQFKLFSLKILIMMWLFDLISKKSESMAHALIKALIFQLYI